MDELREHCDTVYKSAKATLDEILDPQNKEKDVAFYVDVVDTECYKMTPVFNPSIERYQYRSTFHSYVGKFVPKLLWILRLPTGDREFLVSSWESLDDVLDELAKLAPSVCDNYKEQAATPILEEILDGLQMMHNQMVPAARVLKSKEGEENSAQATRVSPTTVSALALIKQAATMLNLENLNYTIKLSTAHYARGNCSKLVSRTRLSDLQ